MKSVKKIIYNPVYMGLIVPYILSLFGVYIGQRGVNYYGEVHSTYHNAMVHTICMPFTIYGMLLWIPNTLLYLTGQDTMSYQNRFKGSDIQRYLYIMYMTHYLTISLKIGLSLVLLYSIPLYFAHRKYIDDTHSNHIFYGLGISTLFLTIQEVFGHYYGGDDPSRPEAIFNAIIYATYFSLGHFAR